VRGGGRAGGAARDPGFKTWRYCRCDIAPEDLPVALKKFHERGFKGLNLTVPHKVIACDHIAGIDARARPIGAVNTLMNTAAGWQGYNTDGFGFAAASHEALHIALAGSPVILLGAGGAAR